MMLILSVAFSPFAPPKISTYDCETGKQQALKLLFIPNPHLNLIYVHDLVLTSKHSTSFVFNKY